MSNNPVVSVIMSVYNESAKWINDSVSSILQQTYKDFEFIIICDNPQNEGGIRVLKQFAANDNRIRLLFNDSNIGLTKSLNRGLSISSGKYIARMDADDISMPFRLEKQVAYMESHPEVIVCGTQIKLIGNVPFIHSTEWIRSGSDDIKAYLMFNSCFAHPTVIIRSSKLREYNLTYDESYRQAQDYRMWEVLCDKGEFANLQEKLLLYRISSAQITRRANSSSVDNGKKVRRRMVSYWLEKYGLKSERMEDYSIFQLEKVLGKKLGGQYDAYIKTLLKLYYFTNKNNKLGSFIMALVKGRFFEFSWYERYQFVLISCGLARNMEF